MSHTIASFRSHDRTLIAGILNVLAAILHLGNIQFKGEDEVLQPCYIPLCPYSFQVSIVNSELIMVVCSLLRMPEASLEKALVSRMFVGGGRSTAYEYV